MKDLFFYPDEKLICWFPCGVLDTERIKAYMLAMKTCEWGDEADRFCDFSCVTGYSLDFSHILDVVSFRKGELAEHVNVRLGIYCVDDTGFALSRMYQMLTDDFIEVFVSKDMDKLSAFLGVSEQLLLNPVD